VTFQSAQSYLLGLINESASRRMPNRLDRIHAFLEALDNPQNRYATIHVAGTSGKGSTATMMAAALQAAGHRTGLHTKPHLTSVTERARVDGLAIPEDAFGELLGEMQSAIDQVAAEHGRPTYYETLLALAFLWFARSEVDVAVVEAGVGGTLDGTNVLRPRVAVITNIALDHTDILGETLEDIARDKAGIAKQGVPLVSFVRDAGARRVIEAACADAGAPFVSVADSVTVNTLTHDLTVAGPVTFTEKQSSGQTRVFATRGARYVGATRLLYLDQPATITEGDAKINVDKLSVDFRTGEVKLGHIEGTKPGTNS